jgi:hypothetical protein
MHSYSVTNRCVIPTAVDRILIEKSTHVFNVATVAGSLMLPDAICCTPPSRPDETGLVCT